MLSVFSKISVALALSRLDSQPPAKLARALISSLARGEARPSLLVISVAKAEACVLLAGRVALSVMPEEP